MQTAPIKKSVALKHPHTATTDRFICYFSIQIYCKKRCHCIIF